MTKFPFLRRPVKPVLYSILLALILTAALVFGWQYHLDGIILDHAIDTYAYVGTVVRSDGQIMDGDADRDSRDLASLTGMPVPEIGGPAFLEELPEGLVQWLYDSEYVSRIDSRRTQAALLGDYCRMNTGESGQIAKIDDRMMSTVGTSYYFLEGTVDVVQKNDWRQDDDITVDNYRLRVDRMWSDSGFSKETIMLEIWCLSSEQLFQEGQKIFLVGDYFYYADDGMPSDMKTGFNSPEYLRDRLQRNGYDRELTTVEENRYILIPDGVDSEQYILDFLESTGLGEMLERQLKNQYAATIRRTGDMKMIPLFAKGKAKTYEGRILTSADEGKQICVISNGLSQRNRLSVGDTIQLSLADGCYDLPDTNSRAGWETGEQSDGDELLIYGDYEEYEIIGIYSQAARRIDNALYFPYGDIFIPAEEGTAAELTKPYTFSFKVPGPDYQNFLTEFQPVLDEYGYTLVVEDTGWDDVKESFYTMQTRRQLMLLCAAAAFAAAVLIFAVLLAAHCSYEYGLRRLLGADRRESLGIYGAVFAFTAIPGGLAAVAAAWTMAVHLMEKALAADKTVPLPTNAQCAGMLALWAGAALLAALAAVLVLAWRAERKGLLKLTRR